MKPCNAVLVHDGKRQSRATLGIATILGFEPCQDAQHSKRCIPVKKCGDERFDVSCTRQKVGFSKNLPLAGSFPQSARNAIPPNQVPPAESSSLFDTSQSSRALCVASSPRIIRGLVAAGFDNDSPQCALRILLLRGTKRPFGLPPAVRSFIG